MAGGAARGRGMPRAALAPGLLLLLCLATAATTVQARDLKEDGPSYLYIAHVNDVHNRVEETGTQSSGCSAKEKEKGLCLGGWARISTAVRAARQAAAAEKAGFLFLDIGDQFDGTVWDIVYKGQATAILQNMVKPDAMTLGNHEFSFPPPVLADYIKALNVTPMLGACNVDTSGEPVLDGLVKKWRVFNIGPHKVAVLGWLTPDTGFMQLNAGKVRFNPIVPSVRRCIADLKKEHPDIDLLVGMSHTGYKADLDTAKQIPEVDIILGGHSHSFLANGNRPGPIYDKTKGATPEDCLEMRACDAPVGLFPTMIDAELCATKEGPGGRRLLQCEAKKIPVVQAYYASKYMGHLKIHIPTRRLVASRPVLLGGPGSSQPIDPDPALVAAIEKMVGPVNKLKNKVAGRTAVTLIGTSSARRRETNFGDYMADLLLREARGLPNFQEKFGPVNMALIQGGALRSDLQAGDLTYSDILTALPFGDTIAIKAVKGADIRGALSRAFEGIDDGAGRFPQVSGLRIWHRGPAFLAVRILKPDGTTAELQDGTTYLLASNTYILKGGDNYKEFSTLPFIYPSGTPLDEMVVADLTRAAPNAITAPDPEKERRIINCAAAYVDCKNKELFGPCCT